MSQIKRYRKTVGAAALAALLTLPGIGQAKVSKYGPSVRAVVADLPA